MCPIRNFFGRVAQVLHFPIRKRSKQKRLPLDGGSGDGFRADGLEFTQGQVGIHQRSIERNAERAFLSYVHTSLGQETIQRHVVFTKTFVTA